VYLLSSLAFGTSDSGTGTVCSCPISCEWLLTIPGSCSLVLWPKTVLVTVVQAMLQYCKETREVQLVADKSHKASKPIKAVYGI